MSEFSEITIYCDDSDAGRQISGLCELARELHDRIAALMKSEFGINIDDPSEVSAFTSPLWKAFEDVKKTATRDQLEAMESEARQMQITPFFSEWSRIGDGAFNELSAAYLLCLCAWTRLKKGEIVEAAEFLAYAHERLGKAYQSLYDRKFLGISAKSKAAKRHEGNYLAKAEAHRLAREKAPPSGQWQSRLSAARAIRPMVKAFAESIGKPLPGTDEAILKTIYMKWLPEMPDADTLFAGKRTMSDS